MGLFADSVCVQITVESEVLSPEQISEQVGTAFDVAHRTGEERGHARRYWERTVWQIRAKQQGTGSKSAHDLLPSCIDELLRRTEAFSKGLRQAVAISGGEFAIHVTSTSVPGISLSSEEIRRIADLGLSLDVDVILTAAEDQ